MHQGIATPDGQIEYSQYQHLPIWDDVAEDNIVITWRAAHINSCAMN
jgi:hypothetical protein